MKFLSRTSYLCTIHLLYIWSLYRLPTGSWKPNNPTNKSHWPRISWTSDLRLSVWRLFYTVSFLTLFRHPLLFCLQKFIRPGHMNEKSFYWHCRHTFYLISPLFKLPSLWSHFRRWNPRYQFLHSRDWLTSLCIQWRTNMCTFIKISCLRTWSLTFS